MNKNILFLILGFVLTIALYLWFIKTPYFALLSTWAQSNFIIFFLSLVVVKIIGIVWPPIPGGILTLGSIPIIGWTNAFIADFIGSVIGSSIAFWLGRKYGLKFLHKIFDDKTIDKILKIKIVKHREIEAIFSARILAGATLLEVICYGAGLLKVRFSNFLIAVTLSHFLIGIPNFYFANAIFQGKNVLINLILVCIAIPLFLKFRSRYLE